MGFHQTSTHKNGKSSFHQIGLVRGQFGNVPEAKWLKFLAESAGFDGWEEASWELDLRRCDTDAGAAEFAKERVELAKKPRAGNLHRRHAPPGAGSRRRAEREDAELLQRQGRGEGRVQGVARRRQQPAAHRPVLRAPRERRQAGPRRGAEGPDGVRAVRRVTCRNCRAARSRCRGSSAARRTAGATGSSSRRCPAMPSRATRPPRRAANCRWNCSSNASGRCGSCASSTASRSTWSATRASGRWATSRAPSDYINHMCKAGFEGVGRVQPRRLAHGVAERVRDPVHPRVQGLHPLRPRQGRVGRRASTAVAGGSAGTATWATGRTAGTS